MKSSVFANHYEPLGRLPADSDKSDYAQSQRWAALFAGYIHKLLKGNHVETLNIDNYIDWIHDGYNRLENECFFGDHDIDEQKDASLKVSENTFHALNYNMLPMLTIAWADQSNRNYNRARQIATIQAQGSLALWALNLCNFREKRIKQNIYYSPEYIDMKGSIEGRLTEFDAAIALLGYIRRNKVNYDLIPSPSQFEHSGHCDSNADLLLSDPVKSEVVGIQVKARVSQDDYTKYDKNKIILVDGVIDLGNQRAIKIASHKTPRTIGWAGSIALGHLSDQMKRPDREQYCTYSGLSMQELMNEIFLARKLMNGIRPYNNTAINNVGNRVIKYFANGK